MAETRVGRRCGAAPSTQGEKNQRKGKETLVKREEDGTTRIAPEVAARSKQKRKRKKQKKTEKTEQKKEKKSKKTKSRSK